MNELFFTISSLQTAVVHIDADAFFKSCKTKTFAPPMSDDGAVLDLAIVNGDRIACFPGVNSTKASVKAQTYKFSIGKKKGQDALTLDIAEKAGKMKYGGKTVVVECTW